MNFSGCTRTPRPAANTGIRNSPDVRPCLSSSAIFIDWTIGRGSKKIMVGAPVIPGGSRTGQAGSGTERIVGPSRVKVQRSLPTPRQSCVRVVRDRPVYTYNELVGRFPFRILPPQPLCNGASTGKPAMWRCYPRCPLGQVLPRKMITLADSNPSIAAVGPTSNEVLLSKGRKLTMNLEDGLQSFINRACDSRRGYVGGRADLVVPVRCSKVKLHAIW